MLGEAAAGPATSRERVTILETNIDDISPQILGYAMDRAFVLGALDCWFTPIQMKKNRPASMLSVLCTPETVGRLTAMIYSETTTLGIRVTETERDCLVREMIRAVTKYGAIDVKVARLGGRVVNAMPEYDQVAKIADETGLAFRVIQEAALAALENSRAATDN
jgi:uncharacterized protein (DUF111 family)